MLFNHVLKLGEKDWAVAVPGKTGKEVRLPCINNKNSLADAIVFGTMEVSMPLGDVVG
jgi:hypothetical protein